MNIGILTRHAVTNYGSLFQSYALQSEIEKLGHNATIINYVPSNELGGALAFSLAKNKKKEQKTLKKIVYFLYQYPSCLYTFIVFKKYRKKLLKETKEFKTSSKIEKELNDINVYCTGSDQVWNVLNNNGDDAYFFSFLSDNKKRISYASSFGGNEFYFKEVLKYTNLLEKYSFITVRENSGVEILKRLGIKGRKVIDPTLLLTNSEWNELLPKKEKKHNYILIYQLNKNSEFDKYAKEISKITGLEIIRISTMFYQIFNCGRFIYLPKPEEFLWYIKNAEYMLTDSFHGTCFSIQFRTKFIEFLPPKFNERNLDILKSVNLEDRILNDYNDYSILNKSIDWNTVHQKLSLERDKSKSILIEMINKQ